MLEAKNKIRTQRKKETIFLKIIFFVKKNEKLIRDLKDLKGTTEKTEKNGKTEKKVFSSDNS